MVILLRFSSWRLSNWVPSQNQTFDGILHDCRSRVSGRQPDHVKAVKNYELALAALSENGLDEGVSKTLHASRRRSHE